MFLEYFDRDFTKRNLYLLLENLCRKHLDFRNQKIWEESRLKLCVNRKLVHTAKEYICVICILCYKYNVSYQTDYMGTLN